ncbi:recombination protein NinG [Pseudomonas sp. USHLN015]|uniref:recombination protein NinG n=1 Tax=Pseudomonas sp. USHLN015 TaxID=3081296 RepID=UPI00301DC721
MRASKAPRPKKCRVCLELFVPMKPLQVACGISCALIHAKAKQAKARVALEKVERRELRAARQRLKRLREYMQEAQAAFNKFIRLRDRNDPCICCGSYGADEDWLTGGKWDAGHFLSRGSHPELRFDEDNCHKQLKSCNGGSSKYAQKGRTVAEGYRARLIEKIGLERVEALEGPHQARRYSIEELKAIKAQYQGRAREMEKAIAIE